jgi:hypothetical protein
MVDLAGSERAAETGNTGQKMRDGANINKSLLALANCINALGKGKSSATGRPLAYIPFRNSKLTRLLKEGLSGNWCAWPVPTREGGVCVCERERGMERMRLGVVGPSWCQSVRLWLSIPVYKRTVVLVYRA